MQCVRFPHGLTRPRRLGPWTPPWRRGGTPFFRGLLLSSSPSTGALRCCKNRTYILFTETGGATRTLPPDSRIHGPVSPPGVGAAGPPAPLSPSLFPSLPPSTPPPPVPVP